MKTIGVQLKKTLSDKDKYNYIQTTHVLEHVSNPYNFLKKVLKHLDSGGYLYLEVPLEIENPETIINDALTKKLA